MIYLIFDCVSANRDVTINEEFDDYALGQSRRSQKLRS
ncbi:pyrimidine deoxynucleoside triphosphate (dYTP) pyrophosphohydrolase YfoO [Klebsiella pneumoniae]|uniref:Pyrimidine deoxynucleoside triphosphate (DYTP) pyrophosphohydrolase YfoO n=1 Tax=Klebsiella pneumoniae TaxID=573 RepID=A0A377TZN7_KLEPN|nr:pyrimidine deoxynucleoside triphosphate (dYTP) pyrophosphohydrolase YfoO [Klebsiella pneumoniae]